MKVTFLGHAAVLIESENGKLLIDPFLTNNPSYIPNQKHIEGITHIFVTHGHQDHIGDTLEIAKRNKAMIISNPECAKFFTEKDSSLHVVSMNIGDHHHFSFGDVQMTPAEHGSVIRDGDHTFDGGKACGFLFQINGVFIYHPGDTGLIEEMKELETYHIDLAFIPIGGHYTMGIEDAIQAVSYLKPKMIVPMHYNTFSLIQADPQEFKDKLPNDKVIIMQSGESITLIG